MSTQEIKENCGNANDMRKDGKLDPYDVCPVYESSEFILRLVSPEDAEDLLLCYSNPEAQAIFNSDNCTSDFCFSSLDDMKRIIDVWLDEFKERRYIRLSIIDKQNDTAVGTIEIFGSDRYHKLGILRIDIHPRYENQEHLGELLSLSDNFFTVFDLHRIACKAIPRATERITTLTDHGYTYQPVNSQWDRADYYIKTRS